jgi:hypothetical protein
MLIWSEPLASLDNVGVTVPGGQAGVNMLGEDRQWVNRTGREKQAGVNLCSFGREAGEGSCPCPRAQTANDIVA